jgi:glucose-1-phosphate cytidylyltransferase
MKYYAHFGHKDFILCLGWKGNALKNYFLNYDECASNDFVLQGGGKDVQLLNSDIHDWKITFVDTGASSNIGERLKAVEPHLDGEETFLANYSDGLSDLPLPEVIDFHHASRSIGTFMAVKPIDSFHTVTFKEDGIIDKIGSVGDTDCWINAGFFVFQREIFDYLHPGEELVVEPFDRLIAQQKLRGYKHRGFFACMDTFKQKQQLDDLYTRGETPWAVWRNERPGNGRKLGALARQN